MNLTLSKDLIRISSEIIERAKTKRTACRPDGYGDYEEVDIGPDKWLMDVSERIMAIAKELSKKEHLVSKLLSTSEQLEKILCNLVPQQKTETSNGASVSEKTSDESKRKQAMLIWTNPYSDVIFCQDEETRKNPFENEVEILRDFGHNVDLKTYKRKLTERGYDWCEIMHYNDRSATKICDASDGYVFNHCYSGMKVGDTKVW